jgi:predicted phosphoribosyltransferase
MFVRNEDILAELAIDDETFDAASARAVAEIERRRRLYLGGRPAPNLRGRTAIVVDDGVATGATTRAALRAVRALGPSKIVLAIPVAPPETLAFLKGDADDIVCLETPDDFCAVGAYYRDFRQIDDDEVIELLKRASAARR